VPGALSGDSSIMSVSQFSIPGLRTRGGKPLGASSADPDRDVAAAELPSRIALALPTRWELVASEVGVACCCCCWLAVDAEAVRRPECESLPLEVEGRCARGEATVGASAWDDAERDAGCNAWGGDADAGGTEERLRDAGCDAVGCTMAETIAGRSPDARRVLFSVALARLEERRTASSAGVGVVGSGGGCCGLAAVGGGAF